MDNQHIQKHIQTVREALSKATPGEWKGKHAITPYISVVTGVVDEVIATVPTRKNMHLIANAPTWLQTSIEIIEQQQREIDQLKQVMDFASDLLPHDHKVYRLLQDALSAKVDQVPNACSDCGGDGEIYWEDGDEMKGGKCPTCRKEDTNG